MPRRPDTIVRAPAGCAGPPNRVKAAAAHARAVLERTFAEAHQLASETIGGEHILLAVLAVDGTGVRL